MDPTIHRDVPSSDVPDDLEPPLPEKPHRPDPAPIDEPAGSRMRSIAYLLDESLPIPGTPFRVVSGGAPAGPYPRRHRWSGSAFGGAVTPP